MNDRGRKALRKVIKTLNRVNGIIEKAMNEEEKNFDRLGEEQRRSKSGERIGERISDLADAICLLEDVVEDIEQASC